LLGLSAEQLDEHIAWDPGAAQVARKLSDHLCAPLVLSSYSRLVIDCNRPLASSELIPERSAGIVIPGNQNLTQAEREQRIKQFFSPYHCAIDNLLEERLSADQRSIPKVLLSIHSFTPALSGELRPWNIGVAAKHDKRFAQLLYAALCTVGDIHVGYDQPYKIDDNYDYTVPVQGEGNGLHSAMIEIRQDGLKTAEQIEFWAERLTQCYQSIEAELLSLRQG
jgi:predicted N-formylglutamate amidohydrolase